jgi:hypothetical protein
LWRTRQKNVRIRQQDVEENENLKGDVETVESNEGRDRELVEDKGARVCTER